MVTITRTFVLASMAVALLSWDSQAQTIRSGHNLLEDFAHHDGIGSLVEPVSFRSIANESFYFDPRKSERKSTVFLFMSTTCLLAKRYTMRLKRLHESYREQVDFFAIFPNAEETQAGIANFAKEVDYPFPVLRDVNGYWKSGTSAISGNANRVAGEATSPGRPLANSAQPRQTRNTKRT